MRAFLQLNWNVFRPKLFHRLFFEDIFEVISWQTDPTPFTCLFLTSSAISNYMLKQRLCDKGGISYPFNSAVLVSDQFHLTKRQRAEEKKSLLCCVYSSWPFAKQCISMEGLNRLRN